MQTTAGPLTQLLQSTTKMLRDGSTPAVIVFVNDSLREIEIDIIENIWLNHQADQKFIDDQLVELQDILNTYNQNLTELESFEYNETTANTTHVSCRGATDRTGLTGSEGPNGNAAGQETAGSEAELCLESSR